MQLHTGQSDLVRAYLAERDVPCPRCGANLRGVTGDRCPTCGYDLHLVLAGAPRQSWPFYAGLFGLAVATTALTALLLSALFHENWGQRSIVGVVGLSILWLQIREWIQRGEDFETLPRFRQYERISLCWLWAALAVFLMLIL